MFNFVVKKMLKSQMKGVPEEQQEIILKAFEKDPKLFKNIASEIKQKTKAGQNEQFASMEVMMKYKNRLQELMKQ
jgi:hypothetical protein